MEKYIVHDNLNEMYHYGVKGMKWGVRRQLKKDIKNLRNQYKKTYDVTSRYDSDAAYLDEVGSKMSGLTKKGVQQQHDRAVDESRRMRQMEKDFVNKWGQSRVSEINKTLENKGERYSNYVLSMAENRSKYSEGAKGNLPYMFAPWDNMEVSSHDTLLRYKR